jgi:transcriptional regulator with XRE-family HTH domain
VKYLLGNLRHGGMKELCRDLDINMSTLNRWKNKTIPSKSQLATLARSFGLAEDVDLRVDPVFLSLDPPGVFARKEWLKSRLDEMSPADLRKYFPALKALLGGK